MRKVNMTRIDRNILHCFLDSNHFDSKLEKVLDEIIELRDQFEDVNLRKKFHEMQLLLEKAVRKMEKIKDRHLRANS